MPRYEKVGRTKENLFELILDDSRLYVADGSRASGATAWEFKSTAIRCYPHPDAAAAKAAYEAKIAELVGKKYVLAGDSTPHVTRFRLKSARERSGTLDPALVPLRTRFETATTLALANDTGGTLSITLDKVNLLVVRGEAKQTMFFPRLSDALDAAAIELWVATTQDGYTIQ